MPDLFLRVNNPSGTKSKSYLGQLCIKPQKTKNNQFQDSLVDNFTLIEACGNFNLYVRQKETSCFLSGKVHPYICALARQSI